MQISLQITMQAPQVPAWILLKSKEDPSYGFQRTSESGPSVRRHQETLLSDGFHLEQGHPVICSSVARTASSCVINAPPTTGQDAHSTRKQRKKTEKKIKLLFLRTMKYISRSRSSAFSIGPIPPSFLVSDQWHNR